MNTMTNFGFYFRRALGQLPKNDPAIWLIMFITKPVRMQNAAPGWKHLQQAASSNWIKTHLKHALQNHMQQLMSTPNHNTYYHSAQYLH